jgi:hypothetical protein
MAGERSRSLRVYLRRRKAQIRREQGTNSEAAIEALLRQYPRPSDTRPRAAGADPAGERQTESR